MRRVLAGLWGLLAVGLAAVACTPEPSQPNLAEIYSRVAEARGDVDDNLLITVPGTLGSRLVDSASGTVVWGGGARGLSADPDDRDEARLIALPILGETARFADHRDTVVPAGILDVATAEVLGIPIDFEVYGGVRRTLRVGGFRSATLDQGDRTTFARAGPEGEDDRARLTETLLADIAVDTDEPALAVTPDDYGRLTEEQANSFRFDYDWRRDLASLAREFDGFVRQRQREVAASRSLRTGRQVTPEDVRFDLLAHSMGGLVVRYYLMYGTAPLGEDGDLPDITWAGARHFDRVIFVAAPNAGSIIAFENLVNGKALGPFQPHYSAPLLATHASLWQLMPRTRHRRVRYDGDGDGSEDLLDIYDPAVWERHGWGLAGPDAEPLLSWLLPEVEGATERRRLALAHQARMIRRARRFHRAMDRWRPAPANLELYLVVGGGFATPASAAIDRQTGALRVDAVEEGDGVVLRASALLDERQGGSFRRGLVTPLKFGTVLFLPDEHVELTKNPVFGDNLLFWLLEQPRDADQLAAPDAPSGLAPGGRGVAAEPGLRTPRLVTAENAGIDR